MIVYATASISGTWGLRFVSFLAISRISLIVFFSDFLKSSIDYSISLTALETPVLVVYAAILSPDCFRRPLNEN
jgi:hypothetical protein